MTKKLPEKIDVDNLDVIENGVEGVIDYLAYKINSLLDYLAEEEEYLNPWTLDGKLTKKAKDILKKAGKWEFDDICRTNQHSNPDMSQKEEKTDIPPPSDWRDEFLDNL